MIVRLNSTLVYTILFLFFSSQLFARNDLRVEVNPRRPQVNSSYTVTFHVSTPGNEDPAVNFNAVGAEILGQSKGMSMRTRFINGKLSSEKEISYVYELVSNKVGVARIKNIEATINGTRRTHPDIVISIAREITRPKDFFVEAQVSKADVFVGEGVTVNYYIYSKGNTKNYELKSYPKLNRFLKRFISHPQRSQRVEVEGEIFRRDVLYSARVFAENSGKYYVDPVKVRVEYAKMATNDPFSIGFSFQRLSARNIQSKRITINVRPLPPAPAGMDFTGLVGKHEFKLILPKDRYLVNEAIELKVEVVGGGALEGYDGPSLYEHSALEEFETSSDLRILTPDTASKAYEYTYLARSAFSLGGRTITLSYFDPERMAYEQVPLEIPSIEVVGGLGAGSPGQKLPREGREKNIMGKDAGGASGIIGPVFAPGFWGGWFELTYLNGFLALVFSLWGLSFFWSKRTRNTEIMMAQKIVKTLEQGLTNYSDIFQLCCLVEGGPLSSLAEFVKKQGLSPYTESYLLRLIETAEGRSYLKGEETFSFKYDKRPFRELLASMPKGFNGDENRQAYS